VRRNRTTILAVVVVVVDRKGVGYVCEKTCPKNERQDTDTLRLVD
jgi:hypothetical protein